MDSEARYPAQRMMTVNKEGEGSQARQQKQTINNPQEPYARRTGTAQAHGLISSAHVPETPPILLSLHWTFLQATDTLKWFVSCASNRYFYNTCHIRFTEQVGRDHTADVSLCSSVVRIDVGG